MLLFYGVLVYSAIFVPKRIIDWLYAEHGFVSETVRLVLSAASSVCFVAIVLFIAERRVELERRRILLAVGAFLALLVCLYLYFFEFVTGG